MNLGACGKTVVFLFGPQSDLYHAPTKTRKGAQKSSGRYVQTSCEYNFFFNEVIKISKSVKKRSVISVFN